MCKKCGNTNNCNLINQFVNIETGEPGRDGISAKTIAQITGQFTGTTDDEFVKWNRGEPGGNVFEVWLEVYGSQYPDIKSEKDWVDSGYGQLNVYENFDI